MITPAKGRLSGIASPPDGGAFMFHSGHDSRSQQNTLTVYILVRLDSILGFNENVN